ncbi:MAG: hypothetical protein GTO40_02040 [Deltaproteobacteria bacterium]|nr:hypothetical protein [Deltaproteobacteria bacterium]
MRDRQEAIGSSFFVLFFLAIILLAKDWPVEARTFPWVIGLPMTFLGLLQVAIDLGWVGARGSGGAEAEKEPLAQATSPKSAQRRTISIFLWIYGFLGLIWLVGFPLAVPLVVFCYLKIQSHEGWYISLGLTAMAWGFLWGVFDRFLHLPFPDGMMFQWLA